MKMNVLAKQVATQHCPQSAGAASPSTDPDQPATVQSVTTPAPLAPAGPSPPATGPASGSEQSPDPSPHTSSSPPAVPPDQPPPSSHQPPSATFWSLEKVTPTIQELEARFLDLITEVEEEICEKEVQDKRFLKDFRQYLQQLLPASKNISHVMFFRECEQEIIEAKDAQAILAILCRYIDYRNCGVLQEVVVKFCGSVLQASMREYYKTLEIFETVNTYTNAISAGKNLEVTFSQLVLKINKSEVECTLYEIRKLIEENAQAASLDPSVSEQSPDPSPHTSSSPPAVPPDQPPPSSHQPPSATFWSLEKVKATIQELEAKFLDLITEVEEEICEKEAQDKKFLRRFRKYLQLLPAAKKATHVKFFRECEREILEAKDAQAILAILCRYINYRNCGVLQEVVVKFCGSVLQASMREYCKMLERFERATTVSIYTNAISAGKSLKVAFSQMALKINKSEFECTLYEIRKLKEEIAEAASLHSHSVYIESEGVHGVEAVVRFPSSVAALTPDFMTTHHLTEVALDGTPLTTVLAERDELMAETEKGDREEDSVTEEIKKLQIKVPEMPSYYKFDRRYPGIRFFGTPWTQTVSSAGAHITSWWEEIGVEFDIPPGAVPKGRELELSVWPCSNGPFQLPDDYELASPVFLISPSFKFTREITLTMCHFSNLEAVDCKRMDFLSAPTTPRVRETDKKRVYQFRVLQRGIFEPQKDYGRISLTHFCTVGIGRKRNEPSSPSDSPPKKRQRDENKYIYQVYQDKEFEDVAIFSAFLEHKLFFTALKERVKEYSPQLWSSSSHSISVEHDKIALEWPPDTGWEVTPNITPCELTKDMLDSHERDPYPQMIVLKIERDPSSSLNPKPVPVKILGITERQKKFILKPKLRQSSVSSQFSLSSSSSGPFSPVVQSPQSSVTQSLKVFSLSSPPHHQSFPFQHHQEQPDTARASATPPSFSNRVHKYSSFSCLCLVMLAVAALVAVGVMQFETLAPIEGGGPSAATPPAPVLGSCFSNQNSANHTVTPVTAEKWLTMEPTVKLLSHIKYTDSKGQEKTFRLINEVQNDCRNLGTQLGIDEATLKALKRGHDSPSEVCKEVLLTWINRGGDHVTWAGLLQALDAIQLGGIGKHLREALIIIHCSHDSHCM